MQTHDSKVAFKEGIPWAGGLRRHLCLAGVAMLLVAAPFGVPEAATGTEGARGPQGLTGAATVFEANRGQADPQGQFLARSARYTAFLTSTEMVLQLGPGATIRLKPVGTELGARISGDDELPGVVNYFRHEPSTAISAPTYGRVRYADIYPGIDLV